MKKILFVFNHPAPYKVRLFNELSKHFDLTVIFERNANKDRTSSFYSEQNYSFKTIFIKGFKLGNENVHSNQIVKHLKKNRYDLIVMNGYSTFAEMKAIKYLKKNNIPYVFYINGGIINESESKFKKNLKQKYISGASAYFSPDEVSNEYLAYYGANKNVIINYPYSTIYEKEIASFKEPNDLPFEKILVSCGQLIKRKNYMELVKAFETLPKNWGLYIFGEGKQRKEIENYIKSHSISNVVLMGFKKKEEIFSYFRKATAFIFPSNKDIYGHVINEALSQGLPVISTKNANSAKHLIKDGVNGYLIDNIATANLEELINSINDSFMKNAIKVAKENTIEKMVENHIEHFERLME